MQHPNPPLSPDSPSLLRQTASCLPGPSHEPSNLPSGFLDEPTEGWDARELFGDEAPVARCSSKPAPDEDDIPTVKRVLVVEALEPDPGLLSRAEPVSPLPVPETPADEVGNSVPPDPDAGAPSADEVVELIITTTPLPPPNLLARLQQLHRRKSLLPWWLIEQCHALAGRILS